VIYNISYDIVKDFEPVSLISRVPQLFVAKSTLPPDDLSSFFRWLRENHDRSLQGIAAVGSPDHIAGAQLQSSMGIRWQFVPYRGAAPMMQDLVAGNVDWGFPFTPEWSALTIVVTIAIVSVAWSALASDLLFWAAYAAHWSAHGERELGTRSRQPSIEPFALIGSECSAPRLPDAGHFFSVKTLFWLPQYSILSEAVEQTSTAGFREIRLAAACCRGCGIPRCTSATHPIGKSNLRPAC
jgi:hypothetical protein